MPQLRTYVHLADEQGQTLVFGPASDVPSWAVAKITNPDVWAEAPTPAVEVDSREAVAEPPRGGPGASKDAWRNFAAYHQVTVPKQATRDDIIAACVAVGVIEE